jgi:hypothetical protein
LPWAQSPSWCEFGFQSDTCLTGGFQLPFFPQYIAFFICGHVCFQRQLAPKHASKIGAALVANRISSARYWLAVLAYAAVAGTVSLFFGGLNWQMAFYAFWEQAFASSVSIGLIVWFRGKLNFQNRFMKLLSDNSYAAYILQAPVLVGLALSLAAIQMPLVLKFFAVTPVGVLRSAFCGVCG